MAASLCLLVSAAIGIAGGGAGNDPREAELLAKGWTLTDSVSCEGLRPGSFYEIGNNDVTVEIYRLESGGALASRQPLPEPPFDCRAVVGPQFVEEIR